METEKGKTDYLLSLIREGKQMTLGQQLRLTAYLSVPAIMAQVSSIAMQYIDASMVGSLGAEAAASIGLVSTTTWLFWGIMRCRCNRVFRSGSAPDRSRGFRGG